MNQNPTPKLRAAVFTRVSTDTQTITNQTPEIVQLCRARGLDIVTVYEERGSAVAKKRPELDRMRLAAHRGEFDVLVVWSLDRIGRSMVGNMQAVLDLDRCGVQVLSVREAWLDTSGPVRSLLLGIFGWVAEQERNQIVARTKAGMARARAEGKRIGRPPVHVDVARALELRAQGLSIRAMARTLGVGGSTVHRALQVHDALAGAGVSNGGPPTPNRNPMIQGVDAP